jgi:predicted transcriptional regulator
MNPDDELALIEIEKERRRRAKLAAAVPTAAVSDAGKEGRDEELMRRIEARPFYEQSFATGAKQGVTASFGDELAGAAGALGNVYGRARDALTGFEPVESDGFMASARRAYREALDEERTRLDESRAAEPLKTGAGQVLSSLLLPAGAAGKAKDLGKAVLTGIGVGGLQGVVTGAGESKTLEPQELVGEMTKTGLMSALTGGAAPAAVQMARGVAPAVASLLSKPLTEMGKGADIARLATTKGATGANIEGLKVARLVEGKVTNRPPVKGGVPEAARIMREYGMATKASTTTALNEAATKTRETISEAKEMLMQQADEAGANVTSLQLAERLRDRARKLVAYNDANKPTAELMFAKADEVAGEGQTYSVMDMQRKANITGELAGNWTASKAANKSEQEFVRAMRDTADDAVESALLGVPPSEVSTMVSRLRGSPGPKGAKDLYQELRKAEQVARLVEEQTAESLARAAGGRLVGLREAEVAKGAGGAAGSMGLPAAPAAAAAVGGFKAMSARGSQLRATVKETAAALGERLGNLSRAAEAPASAASARAAGAITSAVRGAGEAKYRAPMSPDDVALADDLRRRGMSEDEIASILGLNQRSAALDELR